VPPALRRAQILQRIQRDGGVSVAELARDHAVSAVTVHRDLEELAREGLVERVHGGARSLGSVTGTPAFPTAWAQRAEQSRAAKAAIAAHAARYVEAGATIFLDASSSALALARRLVEDPPNEITLVTNSPAIAYEIQAECCTWSLPGPSSTAHALACRPLDRRVPVRVTSRLASSRPPA
jgi:DeoR family fructose operon transcriptional repressor